jgi:protein-S-isoprenylcysteine O-methyltransferase Ste14
MFGRFTGHHDRGRLSIDRRRVPLLIAIAAASPLFVFAASCWPENRQAIIQTVGIGMIVVSVLGRTWCAVTLGSRKTYELITTGPYSIVRNPLYVFSVIGAAGMGTQFGAVSFATLSCTCVAMVLYRRVLQEEQTMLALHGNAYRDYMVRVPRFLPRAWSWRSSDWRLAEPKKVMRTFVDACFFLLAIPLAAYLQYLQHTGRIHVIAWLP